jgi:hypothetical protein
MPEFVMQIQKEGQWCWAAVAVSINQYLDPLTSGTWTQEKLATQVLQGRRQIPSGVDCSKTPGQCNLPARLDDALTAVGNLGTAGAVAGILSFEDLMAWIDKQLPVCARIVWFTGSGHFVALTGYRTFASGLQQVYVQDPSVGPSYHDYEELVADYPPGGSWQDTYLVKP